MVFTHEGRIFALHTCTFEITELCHDRPVHVESYVGQLICAQAKYTILDPFSISTTSKSRKKEVATGLVVCMPLFGLWSQGKWPLSKYRYNSLWPRVAWTQYVYSNTTYLYWHGKKGWTGLLRSWIQSCINLHSYIIFIQLHVVLQSPKSEFCN